MSRTERACYLVAAVLVLSGLVHLGILVGTGDDWTGPVSWRKPATFGLSFGLTLATVTWVSGFVPLSARARRRLLVAFAAACVGEVLMITLQRWRGLPSHFIPAGSPGAVLNGVVGAGAAAGAVVLVIVSVVLTVAAFRPDPDRPAHLRLAVRAGLLSFLLALAVGVVMLARGLVLTRAGDVTAAFAFSGGLKPGHAATMHGILVLPLLARVLDLGGRDERFRMAVVRVGVRRVPDVRRRRGARVRRRDRPVGARHGRRAVAHHRSRARRGAHPRRRRAGGARRAPPHARCALSRSRSVLALRRRTDLRSAIGRTNPIQPCTSGVAGAVAAQVAEIGPE